MALKDFDWKQFLLMKGELVGLGLASVLALTLIVINLFWPGRGFLSGSSQVNAKELADKTSGVENDLRNNKPGPSDLPPSSAEVLASLVERVTPGSANYQLQQLFQPNGLQDSRRKMPEQFQPTEGTAAVALLQLKTYIFDLNFRKLLVLKAETKAGGAGGKAGAATLESKRVGKLFKDPQGMGKVGAGGSLGTLANMTDAEFERLSKTNPQLAKIVKKLRAPEKVSAESNKPEFDTEFVPIEKLGDPGSARLAEALRPLRMAIIVAGFPYKAQLEEHMRKLRLTAPGDVIQEVSMETTSDGQALPAFRFLGVKVQRRLLNSEGKPVGDWAALDLNSTYKPFIVLSGKRFEAEDPVLTMISFPGLVMPKLPQFREGQYPDIEKEVPSLAKTIAELTKKPPAELFSPSKFFGVDDFDIFASGPGAAQVNTGGMPAGTTGGLPKGARPDIAGGPMKKTAGPVNTIGAGAPGGQIEENALPEHCLVRLIDATIEPGKTYQYRIQVRMANPNYGRKDVAAPNYATDKELFTDKWFEIPTKVVVPPEHQYYAVDQKELDKEYKGPNAGPLDKDRQIAMQIHKWLESLTGKGGGFMPVGEWTVAERMPVYRGEYIGRTTRVEVPVWKTSVEDFVLMTDNNNPKSKVTGYPVDFSLASNDALLVDFEGGNVLFDRVVSRLGDREQRTRVQDKAAVETLILSPDGRLLSRDSTADAAEKDRTERLETWRKRIQDVRDGKGHEAGGAAKPMVSPFAK